MYSNIIVNLQESSTILDACKKVWKLIGGTTHIYIFVCVCVCVCVCVLQYQDITDWKFTINPYQLPITFFGDFSSKFLVFLYSPNNNPKFFNETRIDL